MDQFVKKGGNEAFIDSLRQRLKITKTHTHTPKQPKQRCFKNMLIINPINEIFLDRLWHLQNFDHETIKILVSR